MGPDEIHTKVLKELSEEFAVLNPFSFFFNNLATLIPSQLTEKD